MNSNLMQDKHFNFISLFILQDDLPRVQREINALRSLRHQHISQMYQVIDTPEDIYIVMEVKNKCN